MKTSTLASLTALVLLAGAGAARAERITVYTDKSAWLAAVGGGYAQESFGDSFLNSDLGTSSSTGSVSGNGVWSDRLRRGGTETRFQFTEPVRGFGGQWDLTPGGPGQGISVEPVFAGGRALALEIPRTASGQFYGIVSDTSFSAVVLKAGTQQGVAETFRLDNVVYGLRAGVPPGASVAPEPGSLALLATGAIGLLGYGWRRRRA